MTSLKNRLRILAGSQENLPVLLASRTANLMGLAAQLLCHPCQNILITDLGWPPYHDILQAECHRANRVLTKVGLLDEALSGKLSEGDMIAKICETFLNEKCDGLFLTAVSNLGMRLPVAQIVKELETVATVRFVVIDGAQEFRHVPGDLGQDCCDLYLTGVHKWFRAYHPLGLAFYGRLRSRTYIETQLMRLLTAGEMDDPLLRFSTQLENDTLDGTTETVNLAPLFSCLGATDDALARARDPEQTLPTRRVNRRRASVTALMSGWHPLFPCPGLQTGILLLQPQREAARLRPSDQVRADFYARGVALSTYESGRIRLSLPEQPWRSGYLDHLGNALHSLA